MKQGLPPELNQLKESLTASFFSDEKLERVIASVCYELCLKAQEQVDVPQNLVFIDENEQPGLGNTVVLAKMGGGLVQPKALSMALNFVRNSDLIDGLVLSQSTPAFVMCTCVRACLCVRVCVLVRAGVYR